MGPQNTGLQMNLPSGTGRDAFFVVIRTLFTRHPNTDRTGSAKCESASPTPEFYPAPSELIAVFFRICSFTWPRRCVDALDCQTRCDQCILPPFALRYQSRPSDGEETFEEDIAAIAMASLRSLRSSVAAIDCRLDTPRAFCPQQIVCRLTANAVERDKDGATVIVSTA
jgi:hypothetical protein